MGSKYITPRMITLWSVIFTWYMKQLLLAEPMVGGGFQWILILLFSRETETLIGGLSFSENKHRNFFCTSCCFSYFCWCKTTTTEYIGLYNRQLPVWTGVSHRQSKHSVNKMISLKVLLTKWYPFVPQNKGKQFFSHITFQAGGAGPLCSLSFGGCREVLGVGFRWFRIISTVSCGIPYVCLWVQWFNFEKVEFQFSLTCSSFWQILFTLWVLLHMLKTSISFSNEHMSTCYGANVFLWSKTGLDINNKRIIPHPTTSHHELQGMRRPCVLCREGGQGW